MALSALIKLLEKASFDKSYALAFYNSRPIMRAPGRLYALVCHLHTHLYIF